jgi:hypothetical protein
MELTYDVVLPATKACWIALVSLIVMGSSFVSVQPVPNISTKVEIEETTDEIQSSKPLRSIL